jgi:hypothetical protein
MTITVAVASSPSSAPRSPVDIALVAVAGLWLGVGVFGPWAFVGYLAVLHGPARLDSHFQALLGALGGLGDFGALLAGWLQLLSGS